MSVLPRKKRRVHPSQQAVVTSPRSRAIARKELRVRIVLAVSAIVLGALLSLRPWQVYGEQNRRTAEYQQKMRLAEQRQADLAALKAKREGPLGREQSARESGLVKPGEQPMGTPR